MQCGSCAGLGKVVLGNDQGRQVSAPIPCVACEGTGNVADPAPKPLLKFYGACLVCGMNTPWYQDDALGEPLPGHTKGCEEKQRQKILAKRDAYADLESQQRNLAALTSSKSHVGETFEVRAAPHVATWNEKRAIPPAPPTPREGTLALSNRERTIPNARDVMSVLNLSTLVTDNDAAQMVAEIQWQLADDACPLWGIETPTLNFVRGAKELPPTGNFIALVDQQSDVPDALGYHTERPDGSQIGFILVGVIKDAGGTINDGSISVSAVLSHECLEWAHDPACNAWANDATGEFMFPNERADACEANSYARGNGSCAVSDFLLDPWFDPNAPADARFNFLGTIQAPLTCDAGGYSERLDILTGNVDQIGARRDWRKQAVHLKRSQRRVARIDDARLKRIAARKE